MAMFHFFRYRETAAAPGPEGMINGPSGRRGAADAAGYIEGLWKKVLKMDRPVGPEGSKV